MRPQRTARERKLEVDFAPALEASRRWEKNGREALESARKAVESGNLAQAERIHKALMKVERALLDPEGLAGRPWFKHLIYAPRPTYKPLVLPALTEAIEAGDSKLANAEVQRLARALNRAAAAFELGR